MTSHHPAAFINALSESRDFDLAIEHLQQTWNDYCEVRAENARLREQFKASNSQTDRELAEEIHRVAGCQVGSDRCKKIIAWFRSKSPAGHGGVK